MKTLSSRSGPVPEAIATCPECGATAIFTHVSDREIKVECMAELMERDGDKPIPHRYGSPAWKKVTPIVYRWLHP